MRRVHHGLLAVTAAGFLAIAGVACDNTARGVKQDAADAKDASKDAAADAKDASKDAAAEAKAKSDAATADVKAEAKDEKADAKRAGGNAGNAIDAATETLDVKSALMADSTVDASHINVDTLRETKTVVLKGTVPTAAMKSEAGRIAAREAEGYKIDNQLTVRK